MILELCLALLQEHPWSGWKEGTSVTVRTTAGKNVKTETFTVAKTGPPITVKVVTEESGQTSTREDTWNPAVDSVTYQGTSKGTQDLTIDGVKLKCSILEETIESLGGKSVTRRWVCSDAPTPGGLVKEEKSGTASNSAVAATFKLVRLKETVKVKGQAFPCWAVEASNEDEVMTTKSKTWYSKDMPGRIVKSETTITTGGSPTKIVVEVTAVDIKK